MLLRKDEIQDRGFDADESAVMLHHKRGLGKILSDPSLSGGLLFLILSGALYMLFRLMMAIFNFKKVLVVLFPLLTSPYWGEGILNNIRFWSADPSDKDVVEYRILNLHRMTRHKNPALLDEVLESSLSADPRLGMWQVVYLGANYRKGKPEQKKKIEVWLKKVLEQYETFPFNFRYKIIESLFIFPL